MKKFSILAILMLILFSCRKEHGNLMQGKVYIKLIDVHNAHKAYDNENLEKFINNLKQKEYTDSEKKMVEYCKFLIEQDLVKKNFFKLKTCADEIINVYTNEVEYEKISKELDGFDKYKEEIIVKFYGEKKSEGFFDEAIYFADKIILVEKKIGKADWDK